MTPKQRIWYDIYFLLQTFDCNDRFYIMAGTGPSSPILYDLCGTHDDLTVDFNTEFLWMQWTTNNKDAKDGVNGYIQRFD